MTPSSNIKNASKGLVGALAIAGGTSSYGNPVSVPVPADSTNTPGGTTINIPWDVNGDSITDFTFVNRYTNSATGVVWQINMNPVAGNAVLGYAGAFISYGSAFPLGTTIGPTPPSGSSFRTAAQVTLGSKYGGPSGAYYGGFAYPAAPGGGVNPGTQAYAGFSFVVGGQTFYGWIQLSANAGSIDFTNAAYNNTPTATIITGQPVPEPGTMAFLALGGAAVVGAIAKRRRA